MVRLAKARLSLLLGRVDGDSTFDASSCIDSAIEARLWMLRLGDDVCREGDGGGDGVHGLLEIAIVRIENCRMLQQNCRLTKC